MIETALEIDARKSDRCCCAIVVSIVMTIFLVGTVTAILTIKRDNGLYDSKPRVYIQELYVPALNTRTEFNATTLNTSIFIDLEFHRRLALTMPYYADFEISLSYGIYGSIPVANVTIHGFSMGHERSVHKKAVVEATGLPWEDAFHQVSGGSTVPFLVEWIVKHEKSCDDDDDGHYHCGGREVETVVSTAHVWVDGSGHNVAQPLLR